MSEEKFQVELFFENGGQHGPYLFGENECKRLIRDFQYFCQEGKPTTANYECSFNKKDYELTLTFKCLMYISKCKL